MMKAIQILLFYIIISTCNYANGQETKEEMNFETEFILVQDTISINVNGIMTHTLKFRDKYYLLFEQSSLGHYGGHGKRWLCVLKNSKVERVIDCPKEVEISYLDFYVKNDTIILKPYYDKQSYSLNIENYSWDKIHKTDDLIFEDEDFYVYSLDFGEWGGKTWFVNKKTGNQYALECTTPLVNKVNNIYYLTNLYQVLKINNPLELTKCDNDVKYENIEKTRKYYSWKSQSKGYEVIYEVKNIDYSSEPSIVSSFVFNNELLHIYETDTTSYLARIINNKIEPFKKVLDDAKFFNWYYSYRCKNANNNNELLKFKTKNEQVYGLTTIKGNKIYITYLVNNTELKPLTFGKEKSNEILINRLKSILFNFTKLTLTEVETKEKELQTFDISPNYIISVDDYSNPHKYEIDINKSYLIVEDSIVSNVIMYYATKNTNLVRVVTINWENTNISDSEFENEKLEREAFVTKFNELVLILKNELGKPHLIKRKKKNSSFSWTIQKNIIIEIKLYQKGNYNYLGLIIYQRK